jgi:hypothetical protein
MKLDNRELEIFLRLKEEYGHGAPFVEFDEIHKAFDIFPHPETGHRINPYCIALERINTTEKVFWWIYHLNKKRWFSRYHLRALLDELYNQKIIPQGAASL